MLAHVGHDGALHHWLPCLIGAAFFVTVLLLGVRASRDEVS
jgi:hypothetical protein